MKYFEVRQSDGLIVNCIIWDGISNYTPHDTEYLILCTENEEARLGWRKTELGWESQPDNKYWDGTEWAWIPGNEPLIIEGE